MHSERPKIVYNFGLSECNRVKEEFAPLGFITKGSKQEPTMVVSI